MKSIFKKLLFACVLLTSLNAFSQTPEGINYQATVRDNNGALLTNENVAVIFSIKQGSALGTAVYQESHTLTTNNYGSFNAVIGGGSATTGNFSTINWGTSAYYVNVTLNGNDLGTTQLISVPYALYAKSSGSSTPGPQGPIGPQGPEASDNQDIDSVTLNGKLLTVYISNGSSASVALDSASNLFEKSGGTIRLKEGNYTNDFLFGSPQMDNMGDSSDNTRMFFSKETGAFRVGTSNYEYLGQIAIGEVWDQDSLGLFSFAAGQGSKAIGNYSVAMGNSNKASGGSALALGAGTEASNEFSTSFGLRTKATGYASTSFGSDCEASGAVSSAMGGNTKAVGLASVAMGSYTQANGNGSLVVGILNDTLVPFSFDAADSTTPLFIVGNGDHNTWPHTRSNAFTVFYNGKVTINDEYSLPTLDGNANQIMTTDGNGNLSWEDNEKLWEKNGNDIRVKSGDYDSTNFIFGSPQMDDDGVLTHGNRMLYNQKKGAFRVGSSNMDDWGLKVKPYWDEDSLGLYSFASGFGNTASGHSSTSMGYWNKATGFNSAAIGYQSEAAGFSTIAFGSETIATGNYAVAIGEGTLASGSNSTAIGNSNRAIGINSTALGAYNNAIGYLSTAMGNSNRASGTSATVMGTSNYANANYSTAMGRYNDTINSNALHFSIGNGTSNSNRLNSMHIFQASNNAYFRGNVYPMLNNDVSLGRSFNRWTVVYATNGTINTSDTTLKTNIQPLAYGLTDLMKVKTISYNWKDDERQIKKIGFNAQNLLEIIPEVVQTHSVQTDENTGDTAYVKNETLGVFYSDMIPVLTKSIQEQQVIIAQEKAKNEAQNLEIEKLKKDLEELKQLLLAQINLTNE